MSNWYEMAIERMDRLHGTKYDVALSRIINGPTFEAIFVA